MNKYLYKSTYLPIANELTRYVCRDNIGIIIGFIYEGLEAINDDYYNELMYYVGVILRWPFDEHARIILKKNLHYAIMACRYQYNQCKESIESNPNSLCISHVNKYLLREYLLLFHKRCPMYNNASLLDNLDMQFILRWLEPFEYIHD